MIDVRPFASLGHFRNDWLDTHHHFSFDTYFDPDRMGFGPLRVWNDDRIAAGSGFPPHPHRDMEIVTYVRQGAITHEDSLGNRGRTEAGDVQVMSAGTGIRHAEFNVEGEDTTLFQIWIHPDQAGLPPRWETRAFPSGSSAGHLKVFASGRDGAPEDALAIHQDADLLGATLEAGETVTHRLARGRRAYLVVSRGTATVNGTVLAAGDGAAVADEEEIAIVAGEPAEIILADLP